MGLGPNAVRWDSARMQWNGTRPECSEMGLGPNAGGGNVGVWGGCCPEGTDLPLGLRCEVSGAPVDHAWAYRDVLNNAPTALSVVRRARWLKTLLVRPGYALCPVYLFDFLRLCFIEVALVYFASWRLVAVRTRMWTLVGACMRTFGSRGLGVPTFPWGRMTNKRENESLLIILRPARPFGTLIC
ncbi:hypothetical protein CRG98_023841 [Punica granatum]|uniref:Uncharacterized protein n=1 Tax=Punica granatum TaxID=22663 RepID=A0A2I0JIL6_PUNGR|nr:hypothetical protein CRG98_023841 [Punica granatum]